MTLTTKLLAASATIWLGSMAVGGAAIISPETPGDSPVRYDADGKLQRPADYRAWIFLSSGVDMTYGSPAASREPDMHMFTNVFVNPEAYRAFKKTGTWPDKTMLVLEVRHSGTDRRPNRAGMFQVERVGLEAHVKDSGKNGWTFYGFEETGSGDPMPQTSTCNTCHAEHGAVDNTFVQFYPELLDVAKAKGTIKAGYEFAQKTSKP